MPNPFLESLRNGVRLRGYSIKTERSYMELIKRYIYFIGRMHPESAGASEVKALLTYLAVDRIVAINTQMVALNAVAFLYRNYLKRELGDLIFTHATRQR